MGGDGVGDVHIGLRPYAMLLNPVGVTKKADAFASTLCLFVYMHGSCCHVPTCQRTRMPGTCPLASVPWHPVPWHLSSNQIYNKARAALISEGSSFPATLDATPIKNEGIA